MTRALLYLIGASARNRMRMRVRRLKEPRYAVALVVGAAYLWYFLLRPQPATRAASDVMLGTSAELMATLFITAVMLLSWVTASGRLALAYTPAEIHFLFPAPLTRRTLLGYKLLRAQLVLVLNAVLWVFILRRGGSDLPAVMRALAVWVLFSALLLHRMGAALARVSWKEHGRVGAIRQRVALSVVAAAVVLVVWGVVPVVVDAYRGDAGGRAGFAAFVRALQTPPAAWALAPVRWLLRPTFAETAGEWLRAIAPALGVLAVHLAWVLRADVAFEEAAVQASAERAERVKAVRERSAGRAAVRARATRSLPLRATGLPLTAILWKNTLALWRTARPMGGLLVLWMSLPVAIAALAMEGGSVQRFLGVLAFSSAAGLSLFGSRVVRNDLRLDMLHLEQLKTVPMRGGTLVAAEVASSTLALTAIQLVLLVVAWLMLLEDPLLPLAPGERGLVFAAALPALALFNATSLTVQNGVAVLFPAWTKLGPATGGVEVLGQGLIALVGALLVVVVVLVPPALLLVLFYRLAMVAGAPGLVLLALGAAVLLAAELAALMVWLGRAFERAEPSQLV